MSISRTLSYNLNIIIFDDATSAFDNGAERTVVESIIALKGIKTMVIIAHGLSTIENCDTIYEVDNGKDIKMKKKILGD